MARRNLQPPLTGGPEDLAALDPHTTYLVTAANDRFDGDIGDGKSTIRFRAGVGRLMALPDDADEWDLDERQKIFEFLINSHKAMRVRYVWDENVGARTEVRIPMAAYTIEPEVSIPAKKSAKARAAEEAEEAAGVS